MFRNQYDTDVMTYSPAGRLHQVEYAMEAVKQGSACVGLRSKDIVVLASIKRQESELASFQQKIFKIDDHMGIVISGLIADARVLCKYMRGECLNHKYVYESSMETGRLVSELSDKAQRYTQKQSKRPYGVGFLVAGYDKTGPHLYQTDPSGNFFEYSAQAMGARSQAAKTYLESHYTTFPDADLDTLINHAITSLKGAAQNNITSKNISVAYVSKADGYVQLDDDAVKPYVEKATAENKEEDVEMED